jgi:hypothetical protein
MPEIRFTSDEYRTISPAAEETRTDIIVALTTHAARMSRDWVERFVFT